jgi:hypothetical protein
MGEVRAEARRQLHNEADTHGTTLVGKTLRAITGLLDHEEAHSIWTGMWTPDIRQAITERSPWHLKAREYAQVVAALRHLVNGAIDLYDLAAGRKIRTRKKKAKRGKTREAPAPRVQSTLAVLWGMDTDAPQELLTPPSRTGDARQYDG